MNQNSASPLTFADGTDAATGITSDPSGESIHTTFVAYDSLGTPLNVDVTAVLENKSDTGNTWRFFATSQDNKSNGPVLGDGTITFDANGNLKGVTGDTVTIDRTGTGAVSPMSVKLDFSSMTQLVRHQFVDGHDQTGWLGHWERSAVSRSAPMASSAEPTATA